MSNINEMTVELYLKYRRKKTVAQKLNEEGITTTTGKPFSDVAVHRILMKASSDFEENPFSSESRQQLRQLLARPQAKQPKHLLAGILRCECGQAMYVGSRSKKYSCKRCNTAIAIQDAENVAEESICEFLDLGKSWKDLTAGMQREVIESSIDRMTLEAGSVLKIRWQEEAIEGG